MRRRSTRAALALGIIAIATAGGVAAATPDGAALYAQRCAKCHDQPQGAHVPSRESLARRPSINIVMTLLTGAMRPQAAGLSHDDAMAIAAYLTAGAAARTSPPHPNPCRAPVAPLRLTDAGWNGWGADLANTHFQAHPGLTAADVPRLALKWAFAYPGLMTWGQPTVVGGRVFVASTTGEVFALDARTGCTVWSLEVGTPVRTAITVGPATGGHGALAYFGDTSAMAHAIDANTGVEVWRVRVDSHPFARITGSPVLVGARLLVPVSSFEEGAAAQEGYACCTFRGSLVALDARSGKPLWRHRTIAQEPRPYRRRGDPAILEGPAGASVWGSPTVDAARGAVYFGTGNDYTDVSAPTTDAILSVGLGSGKLHWARQLVANDNWASGCTLGGPCPEPAGADADFAASTILVRLSSGRQVLVAGQKSGIVYGLDPRAGGRLLWKTKLGVGGVFGGIEWGMAAIGGTVFAPISDNMPTHPTDTPRPGLGAIDAATGRVLWWTPTPAPQCAWGPSDCRPAQSQAITAIAGIVFSGAQDGHLRAYDAQDGHIVWDFDTGKRFPAVNAESAAGGSLDAGGPVVADGIVYVNSGYGQFLGHGGNVLLALSIGGK
jgi:polyvinyl alcohol dehydrogenase (cytochrome)